MNMFDMIEQLGEVPKLAEGTPLERVQVVNSGARVQIPPSPLNYLYLTMIKKLKKSLTKTVTHDTISELRRVRRNKENLEK